MSDTVISVENLSKSYLIGHDGPQERYHSLRDTIVRHSKNYVRKAVDMARGRQIIQGDTVEEFWALKDVSFEVKRGEVLGIIGRNGAGKSTLLKILSRITEPTSGRVELDGRVASLLEVGTGFHPELTGRENIFLNGAILGMSKAEIRKKFGEIVDFAGVERFLDTPVKRYSSGMYVRLAFAVAAHLEPEILIIDEVLSVGDAEFQKKCLGKMQDVAKGGRTVLFVSHNMGAVQSLCSQCLILASGMKLDSGIPDKIIGLYNKQYSENPKITKDLTMGSDLILSECTATPQVLHSGEDLTIIFEFYTSASIPVSEYCALIYNDLGQRVAICDMRSDKSIFFQKNQVIKTVIQINNIPLIEGVYHVGLWIDSTAIRKDFLDLASFEILSPIRSVAPYEKPLRGFVELNQSHSILQESQ
ncbi:MAG: polysaccharide ABC transporter ATP-binding protein [Chthoniobacterales bacterium]